MTTLTDKQAAYITRLLATRTHGLTLVSDAPLTLQATGRDAFAVPALDSAAASRFIEWLQALPMAQARPRDVREVTVTKCGIYRHDDVLYRVRQSKAGRMYAESYKGYDDMLGLGVFTYEAGAVYRLTDADRLSASDVASLGHLTGVCWVCFRKLTDAKSIAAGIGPVCVKKYGA